MSDIKEVKSLRNQCTYVDERTLDPPERGTEEYASMREQLET